MIEVRNLCKDYGTNGAQRAVDNQIGTITYDFKLK